MAGSLGCRISTVGGPLAGDSRASSSSLGTIYLLSSLYFDKNRIYAKIMQELQISSFCECALILLLQGLVLLHIF